MIDSWFTNKCMTLVGVNGRALSGEAQEAAEFAIQEAKKANHKVWTDRNGCFYHKEPRFFASAEPLLDRNGNRIQICGKDVHVRAKFCSKCGGTAPGAWWRCGGCGQKVGSESNTCPHCGRTMNVSKRFDISNGCWCRSAEIIAERFDIQDIASLLQNGFNIQESQKAILLEGGAITKVLDAGIYHTPDLENNDKGNISLVMVDCGEFSIPVCVEDIFTWDNLKTDLHTEIVLRFDPDNTQNFMTNLMGKTLCLQEEALTSSLGYDEIAHNILGEIDGSARDFCSGKALDDLFKNMGTRLLLEDRLALQLQRHLSSLGLSFVRIKNVEFESELFAKLRDTSGELEAERRTSELKKQAEEQHHALELEAKRRALEFDKESQILDCEKELEEKRRALELKKQSDDLELESNFEGQRKEIDIQQRLDELRNKAARKTTVNDFEQDEFVSQLEHEKAVKAELRKHELEQMKTSWARQQEKEAMLHDSGLNDFKWEKQLSQERAEAEFKQEMLDLNFKKELERKRAEQNHILERAKMERQIRDLALEEEKNKVAAEQEATLEWMRIKQQKEAIAHGKKLELLRAASGADIQSLIMLEDDPEKRKDLLALYEMQQQANMTPEMLLTMAASRGNTTAAAALEKLQKTQSSNHEETQKDDKSAYDRMMEMNERMFDLIADKLAKNTDNKPAYNDHRHNKPFKK